MIDDNGVARLATAGRSSIVAVPGTSIAAHSQSGLDGDIDEYRYSAPEIQWRDDGGVGKILITKESDVYGMGMVAYEVSSHHPASSGPRVGSHVSFLGLDGDCTILRGQRRTCVAQGTGWGNTSTALRLYC